MRPEQGLAPVILTFHGTGPVPAPYVDDDRATYWVGTKALDALLDMALCLSTTRPVEITVDDGNASDVAIMLPALMRRNLTATFFPVTGRIDTPGRLSTSEVRELDRAGMRIGTHGHTHTRWNRLGSSEIFDEMVRSNSILTEIIGKPITEAACPYGVYGRKSLKVLERVGYAHVYTSDGGDAKVDAWLRHRNTVRRSTTPDQLESLIMKPDEGPGGLKRTARRRAKRML